MEKADASFGIVLELPKITQSVNFRIAFERLSGDYFLRWVVTRLGLSTADFRIVVLCHTALDAESAATIVDCSHILTSHDCSPSQLERLHSAAQALDVRSVALLTLGVGFGARDQVFRAWEHHRKTGNNYTVATGVPAGSAVQIADVSLLSELLVTGLPGLSTELRPAMSQLHSAAVVTGEQAPVEVRAVPFDAVAEYGPPKNRLPEAIQLRSAIDLSVAQQVCALLESSSGDGPWSALEHWARVSLATLEMRRQQIGPRRGRTERSSARLRRVLYVSNASAHSGAAESLVCLLQELDRTRFESYALIAFNGHFADRLKSVGATVLTPNEDFSSFTVEATMNIIYHLEQIRPDIVHLNGLDGMPIVNAAKSRGIPVVQLVRLANAAPFREQVRAADAVVAVSDFVRQKLLVLEIAPGRVRTIHSAIDSNEWRWDADLRLRARRQLEIPLTAHVILVVARFEPSKRHDVAFRALETLADSVDSLTCVVVGEVFEAADYHEAVQTQLDKLRSAIDVRVVPFTRNIRDFYAAADVLLVPSENEALPRSVLEGMAGQVPVVAAASGGTLELITHRETGWLVEPGNAEAFAEALHQALFDSALVRRLVEHARSRVQQHFSPAQSANDMMQVYDGIL